MNNKFLALAAAACFASSASAVVVFSDDFEGAVATPDSWQTQQDNPGSRTDNDPANTTGASFSAAQGQWFHYNKSGTPIHDIAVSSNASPGAYQGSNYLRVHRSGDDCAIAAAFTNWDAPITSGTITATWRQYVKEMPVGFSGGVILAQYLDNDHSGGTAGSKTTLFFRDDNGGVRQSLNMFGNNPFLAQPTITRGQWQEWTLVNDLDARTFSLTIDGVTGTGGFNFPGSAVTALLFNGQPGGEYYVDNLVIDHTPVPEPGLASLVLVAGGLLLRRR